MIFFYVKYTKNVKFLSGSRGPHGPDLPSPCGEDSSFSHVETEMIRPNLRNGKTFTFGQTV